MAQNKSKTKKTTTSKTGKKPKAPYVAKAGYTPGKKYSCGGKLKH